VVDLCSWLVRNLRTVRRGSQQLLRLCCLAYNLVSALPAFLWHWGATWTTDVDSQPCSMCGVGVVRSVFSSHIAGMTHITPLRHYLLQKMDCGRVKRPPVYRSFLLVQRFGDRMKKLWNHRNFKVHVSPHEMLQAVVVWSRRTFKFTEQGAIEWLK
jgi:hypothetical protein